MQFDEASGTAFADFEGMRIRTHEEADEVALWLDQWFAARGRRVHVVVNYDRFELAPDAEARWFDMVAANTRRWFLSSVRYTHNAFFRRRSAARFKVAVEAPLKASREEAMQARHSPP
jgi:propionate CoA-transferase